MPEPLGTMACPICGVASPHPHGAEDIQKWLQAQAARFGYKAMVYVSRPPSQPFVARVLASLRAERAAGNSPGSRYELGAYPDTLIEDAIEAIDLLASTANATRDAHA